MLVIRRRKGEQIQLSDGVTITVTSIEQGKVAIGIEAPSKIKVRRSRPCVICKNNCYGVYLGYHDVPFCGKQSCAIELRR